MNVSDVHVHQFISVFFLMAVMGLTACSSATPTAIPPTAAPEPTPTTDLEISNSPLPSGPPTVPAGFKISITHQGLELPTALAFDGAQLYVTEFQSGLVKRLTDTNKDGVFDEVVEVAKGFQFPRGLAIEPKSGELYVASLGHVNALRDTNGDGVADENRTILDNLFYVDASHANNGITFGPDGRLYITEGHPRKNQVSINANNRVFWKGKRVPEWAGKILTANPDGSDVQIFAKGFRNPYDLAFDSQGNLYATDNGEDFKSGKPEGDELNLIVKDGDYGFPFFVADPPPDSNTRTPLINFPQASSADGLAIYEADKFPAEFRGSIFIALFSDPRRVVRAFKDVTGKWQYEDFVTNLNRPIAIRVGPDGALYIADMNSGEGRNTADEPAIIYRVEYVGN